VDPAFTELESELGRSSEAARSHEAEVSRLSGELAATREQLAAERARAEEQIRFATVIGRQLDELRSGARGQATRLRLRALREAAELSTAIGRAAGLDAYEAGEERDRILDALEDAIDRVAGDWEPEAGGAETPPPVRRLSAADRRRISVDVGPFADFSQLVRFEDAANAIGATGDISIKRFSEGRAMIDVALSEPVDLLRELESRCDLELKVRRASDDEIVLDVD
jgi:hypothetical protein